MGDDGGYENLKSMTSQELAAVVKWTRPQKASCASSVLLKDVIFQRDNRSPLPPSTNAQTTDENVVHQRSLGYRDGQIGDNSEIKQEREKGMVGFRSKTPDNEVWHRWRRNSDVGIRRRNFPHVSI